MYAYLKSRAHQSREDGRQAAYAQLIRTRCQSFATDSV